MGKKRKHLVKLHLENSHLLCCLIPYRKLLILLIVLQEEDLLDSWLPLEEKGKSAYSDINKIRYLSRWISGLMELWYQKPDNKFTVKIGSTAWVTFFEKLL